MISMMKSTEFLVTNPAGYRANGVHKGWPSPRILIHTFTWTTFVSVALYVLHQWTVHGLESVPPVAIVLAIPYVPFVLFLATGLVVHELGHAVAAWIAGMRVFEISLGTYGESWFRTHLGGVVLQVNKYPLDGYVNAGHKSMRFMRIRDTVMTLGGPIANAMVALAAFLTLHATNISYTSFAGVLLLFLAISSGIRTLSNLYPRQITMGFGTIPSDGLALLRTPFLSFQERAALHADYYLREGLAARESGNFSKAMEWFAIGLKSYPKNVPLTTWSGSVWLETNRYGKARRAFTDLLALPNLEESDKLQGNIYLAWTDLTLGDPTLLTEADRSSQDAIDVAPNDLASRYVRGCVLIELDRITEGLEVLRTAIAEDVTPAYSTLR